jgi:hypothetical protein
VPFLVAVDLILIVPLPPFHLFSLAVIKP